MTPENTKAALYEYCARLFDIEEAEIPTQGWRGQWRVTYYEDTPDVGRVSGDGATEVEALETFIRHLAAALDSCPFFKNRYKGGSDFTRRVEAALQDIHEGRDFNQPREI